MCGCSKAAGSRNFSHMQLLQLLLFPYSNLPAPQAISLMPRVEQTSYYCRGESAARGPPLPAGLQRLLTQEAPSLVTVLYWISRVVYCMLHFNHLGRTPSAGTGD